jgi:quinoprotein glucose dehydrogenase
LASRGRCFFFLSLSSRLPQRFMPTFRTLRRTRQVFQAALCWSLSASFLQAVPPDKTSAADGHPAGKAAATSEQIAPASDEGQQALSSFRKPDGWEAALFAAEPDMANPVAFTVDNQGRVFVCESFRQNRGVTDNRGHDQTWLKADLAANSVQDRIDYHRRLLGDKADEYTQHDDRLRLLVDTNGDGTADRVTVFADGFNNLEDGTGAGVLVHNGDLFYTCIPKLWWLKDTNGDGTANARKVLYDGFGVRVAFRGHDMHGLVLGPDGRVYFSIGDRGYNVQTAQDHFFDPESGAVFRCELDGSNLELFATGLRNPQELAFDDHGYLFTGDNNSDSGDRARWVNVLEGGDTGWRMMYQYISDRGPFNREKIWHPYHAETPGYIVPPVENIGDGPSGLTYYPGTGLGEDFQNCFLMADFRGGPSNSGIRLIKVAPKGAFWEVERSEQLIWSILATDVEFGPDGAIWISDWVDGWNGEGKGRLYRFFDPEARQQPLVAETQAILHAGFQDLTHERLAGLLSHADRRVRLGAQWELAARGEVEPLAATWRAAAEKSLARLHTAWGLAHIARVHPPLRAAAAEVLAQQLSDSDPAVRGAAAIGLAEAGVADQARALVGLLADAEPRVRYAAALACGKLRLAEAVPAAVQLLEENADADPGLRHAGIMALAGSAHASDLVALTSHPSRAVRLAAVVALRKRQDPQVSEFLADVDVGVRVEAARAIHDVVYLHTALPALAEAGAAAGLPDAWVHRVLNAHFRIGTEADAVAIARVAADSEQSEAMRREALEMLATWGEPGELDRVMNRYLPLESRDVAPARAALAAHLAGALDGPQELRTFALDVAARLGVTEAAKLLQETVLSAASGQQRAQALRSLMRLDPELAAPLVRQLTTDDAVLVRVAALEGLAELEPVAALPLLEAATRSSVSVERQAAWDILARVDQPAAGTLIARGVASYLAGTLPADVWMNVIEAAESKSDKQLLADLNAYEKRLAARDPLESYRDCLTGGDVAAGEKLFFTKTELSCVRCHRVGEKGGEVGPALTEIGKSKDLRYLLESIVLPDAKIAENFETVVILTEDDELLTGILKRETADEIELMTAEGKLLTVEKELIATRKKGKSSMPADLTKYMTRRQLRDLVAYLGSLKGAAE